MKLAGMTTWHDAIGNVHGELRGANASDSAILLGSHYDTVKDAGAYDGSMGVITAIAAVKALVATSSACETEAKSETVTRPDTDKGAVLGFKLRFLPRFCPLFSKQGQLQYCAVSSHSFLCRWDIERRHAMC